MCSNVGQTPNVIVLSKVYLDDGILLHFYLVLFHSPIAVFLCDYKLVFGVFYKNELMIFLCTQYLTRITIYLLRWVGVGACCTRYVD